LSFCAGLRAGIEIASAAWQICSALSHVKQLRKSY